MTDLMLLARLVELEQTLGHEEPLARLATIDSNGTARTGAASATSRRSGGRSWGTPNEQLRRGRKGWELRPILPDGSRPRIWAESRAEIERWLDGCGAA